MNRIRSTFQRLKSQEKKAIVPYITPEFPVPGCTVPLILGLEKSGVDLIEVGIPFSDPIADGPTIQRSSHVAIENGVTLAGVLKSVKEARRRTEIPIILMGYVNPIFHFGFDKFIHAARESGVDGMIVPDLLPEEAGEWLDLSSRNDLSAVFLVAPTTPEERIRYIDSISSDFTYCVSMTGVTGSRNGFGDPGGFESFLDRVRKNTAKPFVVGFGISKREQLATVYRYADGAVVGSALLEKIEKESTVENVVRVSAEFISSLVGEGQQSF